MTDVNSANENALDIETYVHKCKAVFGACLNRGTPLTDHEKLEIEEYGHAIQGHADSMLDIVSGRLPKRTP